MKYLSVCMLLLVMSLVVAGGLSTGCGDGGEELDQTIEQSVSSTVGKVLTITIGDLTDMTGASANAMGVINMALDDVVAYFNEHELIPGVNLEAIHYDGQYDPANDIAGYEWLKERGADLIWTPVPHTPVTLRPLVEEDNILLFVATANSDVLEPPGIVFGPGSYPEHEAYTILKWIAENDPDFPEDRPAKIGGAGWPTPYIQKFIDAAEVYAKAHPEEYEWVGGFATSDIVFSWTHEVDELKECDYVIPPTMMVNFIREYRDAGCQAKVISTDAHLAFLSLMADAQLWDELDGTLVQKSTLWWNDSDSMIDLTKQVLFEKHPGEADEIMRRGTGYAAFGNLYLVCEIIKNAIEAVGVDGFDSQALYDAAISYSKTIDGVERYSFGETKRTAVNYVTMYEMREDGEDLFRLDPGWFPIVSEP